MKPFTITLLLLCHLHNLSAQPAPSKWIISVGIGLEAHDERLFDFANAEQVLRQETDKGTRHYSISIKRQLPITPPIIGSVGLAYTQKTATFSRPFDHCFFREGECPYVLLYTAQFNNHLFQAPLDLSYSVWQKAPWTVQGMINILPALSWRKTIEATNQGANFQKTQLQPYALEIHLGPALQWKTIQLRFQYRIFQWMDKEETYLYSADFRQNNPGYFEDQSEQFNPRKFWIEVGYGF